MTAPHCTYLLPIRRAAASADEMREFADYFATLHANGCEVLVADGSPEPAWSQHHESWSETARHLRVDRRFGYLNDKVNGIHTGVEQASTEKIILADDDIRYTAADLTEICDLLDTYEVIRPQNYLTPLPWWARLEAARMLINRATLRTGDYPGTCAFRRATMLRVGHYDGDVLFDNEEIIRHFVRAGAQVHYALNLLVQKRAPSLRKWKEQRPRQAYEDFGLRSKTGFFLLLLPLTLIMRLCFGKRAGRSFIVTMLAGSVLLAERGRRRGKALHFFPASISWFAPAWVLERALSTYWAVGWYFLRGGYPFGGRLLTKGIGRDWKAGRPKN